MVKKLAIFFSYTIFFIVALILFSPKNSFYFFLENQLKERGVVISSEEINDDGFTLNIKHANISYKSIESADISEADIKIFVLYNSLNIEGITLSSTAKSFIPLRVSSVDIVYSILNPLHVTMHGVGEFGEVDAEFNIMQNSLHLTLKPSKKMLKNYKSTLSNLSKTEDGEFIYDKSF